MNRCPIPLRAVLIVLAVAWSTAVALAADQRSPEEKQVALERDVTQGALRFVQDDATVVECPLTHTDVQAEIAGFIARVKVTQTFINPTSDKIEAVYVFPLPHEAAVDDMTMVIAERRIVGLIQRREEARRIYEQALLAGQTAALLEQERPNIFTQSVGNLAPGEEVNIEISYVDVLRYDVGSYEFQFPMVVGPRYNPGAPFAAPQPNPQELQGRVSPPTPDTTRVPDASRISPPVLRPGMRNGHDIALRVKLDAGVPVQDLKVANHQATIQRDGDRRASIALDPADSLPNKDFVLRYDVTGEKPEMAVLAHTDSDSPDAQRLGEGYFMLMIQPQEDQRLTKSPPREIVFLVDVSGSMSGEPTAKVVESMQHMLKLCRPIDTVQVITFASQSFKLFEKPLPVTEENIQRALNFTQGLRGGGGTEMLKGVKLAIDEPLDKERIRIVVMMTDGYIGNEAEIIEHVGRNCGDRIRFWAIGIGSSPNMFLIDGVAKQGGGMGKSLGLQDDSASLTQEVMTRIQRAQLAKIKLDWGPHRVLETFPARLPELWAGRPVIVYGRYAGGASGRITISGDVEGQAVSWPLEVALPAKEPSHDVLAKVWARQKIESLMQADFYTGSPAVEEEVTALALSYRLMSQYTSFVAVDAKQAEHVQPAARPPRRMLVPVPLPEGTRWEGFFGGEAVQIDELTFSRNASSLQAYGLSADFAAKRERLTRAYAAPSYAAPAAMSASTPSRRPAAEAASAEEFRGRGLRRQGLAANRYRWSMAMPKASRDVRRLASSALAGQAGAFGGGFGGYAGQPPTPFDSLPGLGVRMTPSPADGAVSGGGELLEVAAQVDAALLAPTQEALKSGQTSRGQDKLDEARTALLRAYFLASAALSSSPDAGILADQALQEIEAVHAQQVAAWIKVKPELEKKRLDLVLRDRSIGEALDAVAAASGVAIQLIPGSLEDAAGLLGKQTPRVTYLDLRGAKAAEALDWILQPAKLGWQVSEDAVVAGSDRRRSSQATWVYDVSLLILPSAEELKTAGEHPQQIEAAQQAAAEFLTAVRSELKITDAARLTWFAPGQLLVIGSRQQHAAAQALLEELAAAPTAKPTRLAELRAVTAKRAAQHRAALKKQLAAHQLADAARTQYRFGWQLLAAAAEGRLDVEALTELQIVWKNAQTLGLLDEQADALVLRSLWIIDESSRALPECSELRALAQSARDKGRPAIARAFGEDATAILPALYAMLAVRDDSEASDQADAVISRAAQTQPALATIARSLAVEPAQIDRAALDQLIANAGSEIGGDDAVVLWALAARRAGGDTWQAFRAQMPDLLGRQPLTDHVVVLLNRLANPALPLVATR